MNVPLKLGAFGRVLALCFGAGAAVGAAVGPIDVGGAPTPAHEPMPQDPHDGGH